MQIASMSVQTHIVTERERHHMVLQQLPEAYYRQIHQACGGLQWFKNECCCKEAKTWMLPTQTLVMEIDTPTISQWAPKISVSSSVFKCPSLPYCSRVKF